MTEENSGNNFVETLRAREQHRTELAQTYPGEYVAIDSSAKENVLAHGKEVEAVFGELEKQGLKAGQFSLLHFSQSQRKSSRGVE